MEEEFKDIKGYEGLYQISNYGRVYSYYSNKMLKNNLYVEERSDYKVLRVNLYLNKKLKTLKVSTLVWKHFGDKFDENLVVDHIDNDQLNNRIDNLQLISNRENCSKDKNKLKTTSKYIGVSWAKQNKKWQSQIWINKKPIHLGYFDNEYDAHLDYQNKLKEIS